MKIMYMIHSLIIGGAETIVTNYLIQLKKKGQDVVLLQMYDKHTFLNERLEQEGIRVLTACDDSAKGILSKIYMIWNLRKFIAKEHPDIIHVHTGLEKFRYINYPAEKMVFTLHSAWERSLAQGENHRKMLFRLIREGMSIIVLNEKARRDVLRKFPSAKVYVIPNGLDFEQIKSERYDRTQFLKSIQVPESAFVLGHVGRFHEVKNHEKVIQVFSKVLEQNPDAYLVLVGGGNPGEERRVHALVREYNVDERVCFLGERNDATAVMSIFDCLILPSYSEAFGLVVVEAQIMGIRCVVSTEVPEEVCCGVGCVRLSLEENAETWAQEVLQECSGKTECDLGVFDIRNVMQKHMKLYQGICENDERES